MTGAAAGCRRASRRWAADEHGIMSARIRLGYRASVLNVSAGGALVETVHRLLPGTSVELQMETETHRTSIRGQVVRCTVAKLRAASIYYCAAIAFDSYLPWYVDDADVAPLGLAGRAGSAAGAQHTHRTV
jgi:PilZ domain-containing protein